jgi:peptidoglycan hydrolase-like protein with peptidoglycan-binding domain
MRRVAWAIVVLAIAGATGCAYSTTAPPGASAEGLGSGVETDQETVRAVQQQLLVAGFYPGPVDGLMGGRTREAIRAFQRKRGFPVTGRIDQASLGALLTASGTPAPGDRSHGNPLR